ncbi:hypothetical protein HPB49_023034 [Dermacentor silvarum]|uniref:Uncharacterized protein n=1 Tax=Dermacentor silvarum TaxID=543639 RepID=A0ACB8CHW9_DERSI|nr:hypothetical protein HPB49_023034 [Dermacentor silvarum]
MKRTGSAGWSPPAMQVVAPLRARRLCLTALSQRSRLKEGLSFIALLITRDVAFQVAYVYRSADQLSVPVLEPVNKRGNLLSHLIRRSPLLRQPGSELFASIVEDVLASKHQIAHFVEDTPICLHVRGGGATRLPEPVERFTTKRILLLNLEPLLSAKDNSCGTYKIYEVHALAQYRRLFRVPYSGCG